MPRSRPNSRVKDLPDIALLATAGSLDATRVRAALEQTFTFRATHSIPERFPAPPDAWAAPYATMAYEDQLRWLTLTDVFVATQTFLDPVLGGTVVAEWDPDAWRWMRMANPQGD
jgi:hypothetical protein